MDLISHHLFVYREVHISPCRFKNNNNKIKNKERHNKIFTGEAIDKHIKVMVVIGYFLLIPLLKLFN
jgi:hypothetical protein